MKNVISFLYALSLAWLICSCSALDKQVRRTIEGNLNRSAKSKNTLDTAMYDFGQNAIVGVNKGIPSLINTLVESLRANVDTINPQIKNAFIRIDSLSDVEIDKIGYRVVEQVRKIKREVTDDDLKDFFIASLEQSIGRVDGQVQASIRHIIDNTLDVLNSSSTRHKFGSIRDSIFNEATKRQLQETINRSVQPTIDTLSIRIDRIVNKNVPVVHRYATEFLLALALFSLVIIGYIWYQRRRYLRLSKMLTYEIHKIPSKQMYDELVGRIQSSAQNESLEPLLREILQSQGIN